MCESSIKISYVVSTRNRLSFLKILEQYVFSQKLENEEIVVVDGNSNDGSAAYLKDLFDKGVIQQFVSEPDINQAHGWNKALLMARGDFIKKIIDDDVFDLEAIRSCAEWMAEHVDVDFCISDCLGASLYEPDKITLASRRAQYKRWRNNIIPSFTFSDVYLLIRRSSLARFGIYDTQFRMLDWEYSLRCSYLKAKIAYYTGCMALAVHTPGNITSTSSATVLKAEEKIGKVKYEYAGDASEISTYSKLKIFIGKLLQKAILRNPNYEPLSSGIALSNQYGIFYRSLQAFNKSEKRAIT